MPAAAPPQPVTAATTGTTPPSRRAARRLSGGAPKPATTHRPRPRRNPRSGPQAGQRSEASYHQTHRFCRGFFAYSWPSRPAQLPRAL